MRTTAVSWFAAAAGAIAIALPLSGGSAAAAPAAWCSGAVKWTAAANRIGARVKVKGRIASVVFARRDPGRPTYIYLGHGYPDPRRLTIMIPGRDRKRFPYNPEGMFREGKLVCAQGVVKRVQGLPQITVHRWDKPRRMLR